MFKLKCDDTIALTRFRFFFEAGTCLPCHSLSVRHGADRRQKLAGAASTRWLLPGSGKAALRHCYRGHFPTQQQPELAPGRAGGVALSGCWHLAPVQSP
jgi:hypothetical protein